MNYAICIVAYNRLNSVKRLLRCLEHAYYTQPVDLVLSIDKSDSTEIEDYAKTYSWKYGQLQIITHEQNLGLRKHVISCGRFLEKYDAIVVLEDDITVAESFMDYVISCVEKFHDDDSIAGISLYSFQTNYQTRLPFIPLQCDSDIYLMKCAQSWGQVWMRKQWQDFMRWYEINKEEFHLQPHLPSAICRWSAKSWLKYHTRYCIEQNKYFVYPYVSLSTNNSDVGTHVTESSTLFQVPLLFGRKCKYHLNTSIKYDGFFENENLAEVLGVPNDQLCVDFYGEKKNREKRRYYLTRQTCPYKLLNSYSLSYKPYETNIFQELYGNDLFLYDTKETFKNSYKPNRSIYDYFYGGISKSILYTLIKKKMTKRILGLIHKKT